ncbi:hypothetical protein KDN32_13745 [Nocardioides sp. J2M5]|uniref:hypothetical protein n=1 Tax=Nocardioides palaemonis TaxID=2829810 RepID=UPI001BAC6853|nr:hypothetical protein [Nocardioides palaemonis]MBS2938800.1 hypothetical protein [Nocardioides palaemonis]
MSTHDTIPDLEERLRAALSARAELVQPEDLEPLAAPVVELRPAWRSPWVLLATAAVLLLVLGVVAQGIGGRPRSDDDLAPQPDAPRVTLPADVGRDWATGLESTPARVDLDGDGTKERVRFLAEDNGTFDGRVRLQTTLSSTGDEAYGVADVASTIGLVGEGVIDADGDGDQELVVYDPSLEDGLAGAPLVFDHRDGLLVQAVADEPDLLRRGDVQVPGSETAFYDRYRTYQYWIDGGTLYSGQSRDSFARAGDYSTQLPGTLLDTWAWRLDEDGVLHPEPAGCKEQVFDVQDCGPGSGDQVPDLTPATDAVGADEVDGVDGDALRAATDVPDPRVAVVQPESMFLDGEALVVTSATDPTRVQLLVQREDGIVALDPVGEVPLGDTDDNRTWLTAAGQVVTATPVEDGTWQLWYWHAVRGDRVVALPAVTVGQNRLP